MSWTDEFADELSARRVRRAVRERLVAELTDHIACEPAAEGRLGDPREIAGRYADELASGEARRAALVAFGALALTAVALLVTLATLQRIGYPNFHAGVSRAVSIPAILAMLFGSQVAWVAGMLAAWRAARRHRVDALPGAEVALLRSRTRVALVAGLLVSVAIGVYAADFAGRQPAWWLALVGAVSLLATIATLAAWRIAATGSRTVALAAGPAGDLFDDVPPLRPLRGHPLRTCGAFALASGLAVGLVEWHAERSLSEGLERGVAEAVVFAICFAVLGRAVGARR
jgi:hypothetical protein